MKSQIRMINGIGTPIIQSNKERMFHLLNRAPTQRAAYAALRINA
jgi:hypothetical protein